MGGAEVTGVGCARDDGEFRVIPVQNVLAVKYSSNRESEHAAQTSLGRIWVPGRRRQEARMLFVRFAVAKYRHHAGLSSARPLRRLLQRAAPNAPQVQDP